MLVCELLQMGVQLNLQNSAESKSLQNNNAIYIYMYSYFQIFIYRFLTNPMKNFDLRKWAAEGLSFLTLDADVKEELCEDKEALKALFELGQTNDKTVMYGVVSCLVNTTNTFDKGDEITPEMLELAKYAKHHIPEQHEKVGFISIWCVLVYTV